LSLRDKGHSPFEAPRIILAFVGFQPWEPPTQKRVALEGAKAQWANPQGKTFKLIPGVETWDRQLCRGLNTGPLVPFTAVAERGRIPAKENLSARNTGATGGTKQNLCHETLVRRVTAKRRIPGGRVGLRLCSDEQSCSAA